MLKKKLEIIYNEYTVFVTAITIYSLVKFEILIIQFNYFIIVLFSILLVLIMEKSIRESRYLKKLNLKSTANSTMNPTPGKSMLNSISNQGYSASDIEEIFMMSYSLKHQYLIKSAFAGIMKDMNFKLHLYSGDSAKKDTNIIKNFYKNVNINIIKYNLIEHYNIIAMKDKKVFIWYEPNHIVKNRVDILKDGGYLFISNSMEESKSKFFEIIEQQNLKNVA